MIHLYTGEGKGKTTAALGIVLRAAGRDFPVCFAQFMKGSDTGELYAFKKFPQVTILRSGKDFGFYNVMTEENKEEIMKVHDRMLDRLLEMAEKKSFRMIVLDEVTYPLMWELFDLEKLKRLLDFGKAKTGGEMEIVLTGRYAGALLTDAADYITEMKCVRHPYEKGVNARIGIEY